MELLKDNFLLIITKVHRLQNKHTQQEKLLENIQERSTLKQEETEKKLKLLQIRYDKNCQELNFVKFSNQNLRKEIQLQKRHRQQLEELKFVLQNIREEVKQNSEGIQEKISSILSNYEIKPQDGMRTPTYKTFFSFKENFESPIPKKLDDQKDIPLFLEPLTIDKKESKKEWQQKATKKKRSTSIRDGGLHLSTDQKKRQELAKLVAEQGKMARIRDRYMSTDII